MRERLVASLFFDIATAEMKIIPGSITPLRHMRELAMHIQILRQRVNVTE